MTPDELLKNLDRSVSVIAHSRILSVPCTSLRNRLHFLGILREFPNTHRIPPWNKGKKLNYGNKISLALKGKGHEQSKETRLKISETRKARKLGGYQPGSGRGRKGWYKGIWCESSWEFAYILFNIDHSISFARNRKRFEYLFEGRVRKYIPDFVLSDGTFVEIKGYYTKQFEAKRSQFPEKLVVIDQNSIKPYLDYAIKIYGFNFVKLLAASHNGSARVLKTQCG